MKKRLIEITKTILNFFGCSRSMRTRILQALFDREAHNRRKARWAELRRAGK